MILTGPEIEREVAAGRIVIDPFARNQLNPNSYNFRLGRSIRTYTAPLLDPRRENPYVDQVVPPDGLRLRAGRLYLGHTVEVLGGDSYVPTFAARSSVARLGLFINLSASLGDIGFVGQWTLQLVATVDVVVYAGMPIGQMMWWRVQGGIDRYDGKYQNSAGPQSTLIHKDFDATSHHTVPGTAKN